MPTDQTALIIKDVKDAIMSFARAALPTIPTDSINWENEDGLKAGKPFLLMRLTGPVKVGAQDSISETTQQGQRSFNLAIDARSDSNDEALQMVTDFQAALDNPYLCELLYAQDLTVAGMGEPQDLSAGLDTKFEARIRFDAQLYKAFNKDFDISIIEEAIITPA